MAQALSDVNLLMRKNEDEQMKNEHPSVMVRQNICKAARQEEEKKKLLQTLPRLGVRCTHIVPHLHDRVVPYCKLSPCPHCQS